MTNFVKNLHELQTLENGVLLQNGFYERESSFAWSEPTSSLLCKGYFSIYIRADTLDCTLVRTICFKYKDNTYYIRLDSYSTFEISIQSNDVDEITFQADGFFRPSDFDSTRKDQRRLAFRIHINKNEIHGKAHKPTLISDKKIIFVADSKKERDTLTPLFNHLKNNNWPVIFRHSNEALHESTHNLEKSKLFLISSPETHNALTLGINHGTFIFLEHGIGYTKKYSYSSHYTRYDLLLLPGDVFVNRLEGLYPNIRHKCKAVGFPKLNAVRRPSKADRIQWMENHNLDTNLPIVLFAPTWSGGNKNTGIFNITKLKFNANIIGIPHDADSQFAGDLLKQGYIIHTMENNQTICDYYPYADILISDTSSTALEFASLGGISITWIMDDINEFEKKYITSSGLKIPHTDLYWNFYESATNFNINDTVINIIEKTYSQDGIPFSNEISSNVYHLISANGITACEAAENAIAEFVKLPKSLIT